MVDCGRGCGGYRKSMPSYLNGWDEAYDWRLFFDVASYTKTLVTETNGSCMEIPDGGCDPLDIL